MLLFLSTNWLVWHFLGLPLSSGHFSGTHFKEEHRGADPDHEHDTHRHDQHRNLTPARAQATLGQPLRAADAVDHGKVRRTGHRHRIRIFGCFRQPCRRPAQGHRILLLGL
uniref:(northern house mosquito) hypothetical protein n=1 Tax=Culex pipiens TaxID=7175 RepID=A0A8D8FNM6_CULPI